MVQWVGLVRNVMLGREGLSRDALLELGRESGGGDVRSHLTTGNLTFAAPEDGIGAVVAGLESGLERLLGRREMVAVRPLAWLRGLVAEDRFASYPGQDWETEVAFLSHDAAPLDPVGPDALGDPRRTVLVEVRPREVLAARPRTGGSRPHVNRLLEQASGLPATARGWSTLQRLAGSR